MKNDDVLTPPNQKSRCVFFSFVERWTTTLATRASEQHRCRAYLNVKMLEDRQVGVTGEACRLVCDVTSWVLPVNLVAKATDDKSYMNRSCIGALFDCWDAVNVCSRTHFLPINRLCSGRSILISVCFFMTFESWFHCRDSRLRFLQFLGQEREGRPLPIFLTSLWSLRPTRQQGAGKQFYQKKTRKPWYGRTDPRPWQNQDSSPVEIGTQELLTGPLVTSIGKKYNKTGPQVSPEKKDGETKQCKCRRGRGKTQVQYNKK